MSQLSSTKNKNGWLPPEWLREGQKTVIQNASDPERTELKVQATTGYGKTMMINGSFAARKSQGLSDNLLIIVPGTERKDSYLCEVEEDFKKIGFPIKGCVDACSEFALRYEADVFVVNVESLPTNLPHLKKLMSNGKKWDIAADEYHHLNVDGKWGKSASELCQIASFVMYLSATPFRTNKKESTIAGGKLDCIISRQDALQEDAIRPMKVHVMDYCIDLSFGDDSNDIERVTLSEFEQRLKEINEKSQKDITEAQLRHKVRVHSKYISPMLQSIYSCWLDKDSRNPGEHQIIIYAHTCEQAESLSGVMNYIAGDGFSDWVGSGVSGRSEKQNASVINRFLGRNEFAGKPPTLKCLVQVLKASEGFNCIRASVGGFLNHMGESIQADQALGRFARRNYRIEECHPGFPAHIDISDIFISEDHPLKNYLLKLEEMQPEIPVEELPGGSGGGNDGLYIMPDFYVVDANHTGTQLFWIDKQGETISTQVAIARARSSGTIPDGVTDQKLIELLSQVFGGEPKEQSMEEKRTLAKQELETAVKRLTGTVTKVRYGVKGTFPKTLIGDTKRAINTHLKRKFNLKREALSLSEYRAQYEYLKDINDRIVKSENKTSEVPSWLML